MLFGFVMIGVTLIIEKIYFDLKKLKIYAFCKAGYYRFCFECVLLLSEITEV